MHPLPHLPPMNNAALEQGEESPRAAEERDHAPARGQGAISPVNQADAPPPLPRRAPSNRASERRTLFTTMCQRPQIPMALALALPLGAIAIGGGALANNGFRLLQDDLDNRTFAAALLCFGSHEALAFALLLWLQNEKTPTHAIMNHMSERGKYATFIPLGLTMPLSLLTLSAAAIYLYTDKISEYAALLTFIFSALGYATSFGVLFALGLPALCSSLQRCQQAQEAPPLHALLITY